MVMRIGFVGAGRMAAALAVGFARRPTPEPKLLSASYPSGTVCLIEGVEFNPMHSNVELVKASDVVVLAVKPSLVPDVLKEVKPEVTRDKLVVSIAAGVTISSIEECLPADSKVVRVMPNTPSLVCEGATVYSIGSGCGDPECALVEKLFLGCGGECHQLPESLIDAATGISGSGPAYMYLILEAMTDAGVMQGLPRQVALRLAAQTMVGAGKMVLKSGRHPAELKDDVCSPSGSTITAVDMLEKNSIRSTMMQAVEAAALRCSELKNL